MFFNLLNLRQDLARECNPWEWTTKVPAHATASKDAYHKWRNLPSISHQFYSPFEGVNPHARINAPGPGIEGNPPCILHGLVMDIDQKHTDAAIDDAVNAMVATRRPQWAERTPSGNCRLVWIFQKPLSIPSYDFGTHLLKKFVAGWGLDRSLGGFDEKAFVNPSQYFCNGGVWRRLPTLDHPGQREVAAVEYAAATSFGWSTAREWETIPLDKVRDELVKDPRFVETWGGIQFEVDARGPSWWVEGSQSGDSAVVNAKGMYTFSAHATKSFYPWMDLLGRGFVESSTATAISDAVADIYFDGKQYHRKLPNGSWRAFGKEDLISYLTTTRRVCNKTPKGGVSDVARAIQYIQDHRFVDGAAPVVFRESGLVEVTGKTVLNTCTKSAVPPAPGKSRGWGVDFPYIATIIDGLFPNEYEGRKFFMSWLAVFYRMCLAKALASGQNIVIAGGPGLGKTMMVRCIIGGLTRGYAECGALMMGEDAFGGELFENALWCMDDAAVATNAEQHRKFSEALKKMAANRTHRVHQKYAMPTNTQWMGRVVVTCNDDPKSVQMLPSLDHSIQDKLMLFRVPPGNRKTQFLPHEEGNAVVARELPHFARFLMDWVVPDECSDPDPRFGGVKPFADEFLVRTANQSSTTAPLAEILDDFKAQYKTHNPGKEIWRGTSAQLHRELNADNDRKEAMRSYPILKLSNHLATLEQQGYPIASEQSGISRFWVLDLSEVEPEPEPEPVEAATPAKMKEAK